MRSWIAPVAVALCLLAGTVTLAQDKPRGTALTGEELQGLFGGGALLDMHNAQNRERSSLVLTANGTAFTHWLHALGHGGQDSGTWRIAPEGLCLNLKSRTGGAERCYRHYKVGENAYEAWYEEGIARPHLVSSYKVRP